MTSQSYPLREAEIYNRSFLTQSLTISTHV